MKIIIVGLGKHGSTLCEYLSKQNHNVIGIDIDPVVVNDCINQYDIMGYTGNGSYLSTLEAAGCKDADLLVACTGEDAFNIVTCIGAKKIGVKKTIARMKDEEYASQIESFKKAYGIDEIINPYLETANEIIRSIRYPQAIKRDVFGEGRADIVEIKVEANSPLKNVTLQKIKSEYDLKFLIVAVLRDGQTVIPRGNFKILENDILFLASSTKEMGRVFHKLSMYQQKIKNVMIIGGGKLSTYLSDLLIDNGVYVKIIESDKLKCEALAKTIPDAMVINGDANNQKLLKEEGIENVECVVTIASLDEVNIIASSFAKEIGVEKIITKVNNPNYDFLIKNAGLDTIVSPRVVFANNVIRMVRGIEGSSGSDFKSLIQLVDGEVDALEFLISKEYPFASKQLKTLKFKEGILIAAIIRGKDVIIPTGNDTLEVDDSVVIINKGTTISSFEDILEE